MNNRFHIVWLIQDGSATKPLLAIPELCDVE